MLLSFIRVNLLVMGYWLVGFGWQLLGLKEGRSEGICWKGFGLSWLVRMV